MQEYPPHETVKEGDVSHDGPLGGIGPDGNHRRVNVGPGPEYRGRQGPHERHVGQRLYHHRYRAVGGACRLSAQPIGQLALDRHHQECRAEFGIDQQVADHRSRHMVGQIGHDLESLALAGGQTGTHAVEHLGIERVLGKKRVAAEYPHVREAGSRLGRQPRHRRVDVNRDDRRTQAGHQ